MSTNPPTSSRRWEPLGRGDGYLFAGYHNVLIAIWTAQGTGERIAALDRVTAPFARKHPEGFSSVQFIAKGLPLANSEARERLIALMRRHHDELGCIGTVLDGSGFLASATRSLILGMRLLAPQSFDMQTYASIPELSAWLPGPHAKRTGVTLDRAKLQDVLTELHGEAVGPGAPG